MATPEAAAGPPQFPWPLFMRYVYAAKFLCGRQERPVKELGPDFGLEIDCRDIREVLLKTPSGEAGPPAPSSSRGGS